MKQFLPSGTSVVHVLSRHAARGLAASSANLQGTGGGISVLVMRPGLGWTRTRIRPECKGRCWFGTNEELTCGDASTPQAATTTTTSLSSAHPERSDGLTLQSREYLTKLKHSTTLENANQILQEMFQCGIVPSDRHLHTVMQICVRTKEWQKAMSLLAIMKQMKLINVSVFSYTIAMNACEKASQWEKALDLWHEMKERDIKPTLVAYTIAISACATARRASMAMDLWQEMKESGIQPDLKCYKSAMKACQHESHWNLVINLFESLREVPDQSPDGLAYSMAIRAYVSLSKWHEAMAVVDELTERGFLPGRNYFGAALLACAKTSSWNKAMDLLNRMEERNNSDGNDGGSSSKTAANGVTTPNSFVCGIAMRVYYKLRRWDEILRLWENMKRDGISQKPNNYGMALIASEQTGQWQRALRLLAEQERAGIPPCTRSYSVAISACEKVAQWEWAVHLLEEMHRKNVHANVITYSSAISACRKASQWAKALELFDTMKKRKISPDAICYSATISACAKGSQWEKAVELLREMKQMGLRPGVICYAAAISACGKSAQSSMAVELLHEMRNEGIIPNVIAYNSAISACARGSDWETALELISEMPKWSVTPNEITYNSVIYACAKGGQWEKAVDVLHQMHQNELVKPSVISYNTAIHACEMSQQGIKAAEILSEMQKVGVSPDIVSFTSAIGACLDGKQYGAAWIVTCCAQRQGVIRHPTITQPSIDLHGLKAAPACMVAASWLLEMAAAIRSGCLGSVTQDLRIMVGKGLHSGVEGHILRNAVPGFLQSRLGLSVNIAVEQQGSIVIPQRNLNVWIESERISYVEQLLGNSLTTGSVVDCPVFHLANVSDTELSLMEQVFNPPTTSSMEGLIV